MDPSNFVEISSTFLKFRRNFVKKSSKFRQNVRFQSLPAGSVCVAAACGASATSEKTRPWISGACILCILSIFVYFCGLCMIVSVFVGFRVSQQGASVWWLPAALQRPQKKHAPGILKHVSCGVDRLFMIFDFFMVLR